MPANDALLARRPPSGVVAPEPPLAVDALERAAAGIRPSWADAELPADAPPVGAAAPLHEDAISPSDPTEIDFERRRWLPAGLRRRAVIVGATLLGAGLALLLVRATGLHRATASAPAAQVEGAARVSRARSSSSASASAPTASAPSAARAAEPSAASPNAAPSALVGAASAPGAAANTASAAARLSPPAVHAAAPPAALAKRRAKHATQAAAAKPAHAAPTKPAHAALAKPAKAAAPKAAPQVGARGPKPAKATRQGPGVSANPY